jgi:S-adenosylmethionine synthetase
MLVPSSPGTGTRAASRGGVTAHLSLLAPLPAGADDIEVVERKGIGHPDTICDGVAEAISRALCAAYIERFGIVLHHNVDKALLVGGRAQPAFMGGEILEPMVLYLAGRAAEGIKGVTLPIHEIVVETARAWLREHLHAVDVDRHVRIEALVRPGSRDLVELFLRNANGGPQLANDTSCGAGYAPLSATETAVLETSLRLEALSRGIRTPEVGEDTKVMAVRRGRHLDLTVACAFIGRSLRGLDHYLVRREALAGAVREVVSVTKNGFDVVDVTVNAADDPSRESVFLTVSGTSAEAGDDGEVGRGNRVNGLITPGRPMTLEAAAGKNPVTHVGKLYNVAAHEISRDIVAELVDVAYAECVLVSRIGRRIDDPVSIDVRLRLDGDAPLASVATRVQEVVRSGLTRLPALSSRIATGAVTLF